MSLTYTCEVCGRTFIKGWSDEEATAEYQANFPETQGDEIGMICEVCYVAVREWYENGGKEWYERERKNQ